MKDIELECNLNPEFNECTKFELLNKYISMTPGIQDLFGDETNRIMKHILSTLDEVPYLDGLQIGRYKKGRRRNTFWIMDDGIERITFLLPTEY